VDKELPLLTPKQKLALSRAELLEAMGYHEIAPNAGAAPQRGAAHLARPGAPMRPTTHRSRGLLARWWSRHPIHSAVDLGRPFLEDMARRQPGKLMAYGAGTGALLMVIKPWKLLSLATLLSLALRTSNLSGLVAGAFGSHGDDEDDGPPFDDQVPLNEQVS
jgi:hypothetical protein